VKDGAFVKNINRSFEVRQIRKT